MVHRVTPFSLTDGPMNSSPITLLAFFHGVGGVPSLVRPPPKTHFGGPCTRILLIYSAFLQCRLWLSHQRPRLPPDEGHQPGFFGSDSLVLGTAGGSSPDWTKSAPIQPLSFPTAEATATPIPHGAMGSILFVALCFGPLPGNTPATPPPRHPWDFKVSTYFPPTFSILSEPQTSLSSRWLLPHCIPAFYYRPSPILFERDGVKYAEQMNMGGPDVEVDSSGHLPFFSTPWHQAHVMLGMLGLGWLLT